MDSPRAFRWICWVLALGVVGGSLLLRARIERAWASLGVYLLGSLVVIGVSRLQYGTWTGLATRYPLGCRPATQRRRRPVPDAVAGGRHIWLPRALSLSSRLPRAVRVGVGSAAGLMVVALALHSLNGFAARTTTTPYRAFVVTARESLARLPANAQVYDEPLPVGVVGPLFGEYNLTSRFMAPVATAERRHEMYTLKSYTNPYYLTKAGHFVPMTVAGRGRRPDGPARSDGPPREGQVAVPPDRGRLRMDLDGARVGYLAARDTPATIVLGTGRTGRSASPGARRGLRTDVAAGAKCDSEGWTPEATVCVGDVEVGTPAPKK